jgi:hypothetical protein
MTKNPHKKPSDPRGGHTRLYWELQDSMAFRSLDFSAQALWLALRRKLQSTNNGNIEATLSTLRHAGFTSSATLTKGLRSLQAVGLLAITRQGGIAVGQKVCSLYRFTDEPMFAHPKQGLGALPATNEWRQFTALGHAVSVLRAAHAAAIGTPKNKLGLQKLNRIDSETEASARFIDSDSEQVAVSLLQKLNKTARHKPAVNPHEH